MKVKKEKKEKKESLFEVNKLIHDLKLHQIELETQNKELLAAQSEIDEARQRYYDLFNLAPIGYFTLDRNGDITEINLAGADMIEVQKAGIVGKKFSSIFTRESADTLYLAFQDLNDTKTKQTRELILIKHNKQEVDIRLDISIIPFEGIGGTRILASLLNIDDAKKAEREVLRLSLMKDKFLSITSHDLKSPFGIIKRSAQLVLDSAEDILSDNNKMMLNYCIKHADRGLVLIRDLLHIEKLTDGEITLYKKEISLVDILNEIISFLGVEIKEKEVVIRLKYGKDITIRCDAERIWQVFYNVLSNAVKFTSKKSEINITIEQIENGNVRISIADKGPGIPKEMLLKIFEKYQQVKIPGREIEGTGLGLTIAKYICQLHHGDISAFSPEDGGAIFVIVLPCDHKN